MRTTRTMTLWASALALIVAAGPAAAQQPRPERPGMAEGRMMERRGGGERRVRSAHPEVRRLVALLQADRERTRRELRAVLTPAQRRQMEARAGEGRRRVGEVRRGDEMRGAPGARGQVHGGEGMRRAEARPVRPGAGVAGRGVQLSERQRAEMRRIRAAAAARQAPLLAQLRALRGEDLSERERRRIGGERRPSAGR